MYTALVGLVLLALAATGFEIVSDSVQDAIDNHGDTPPATIDEQGNTESDTIVNLNNELISFTETATRFGYQSQEHNVTTADGYILKLFNLRSPACQHLVQPPVLVVHSLLQSADSFIDAGPDAGIAFLLADDCRDVWAGNTRGNYYGRAHTTLNPDKHRQFWANTTGYEMGTRDLPAHIDHILGVTGAERVDYIGHGQGAQVMYIMCAERPEYNDKIRVSVSLAPATRLKYSENLFSQLITTSFQKLRPILQLAKVTELFYRGSTSQFGYQIVCNIPLLTAAGACETIFLLIDDFHRESIEDSTLMELSNHEPSGTSFNNFIWFGQLFSNGRFETFDYGTAALNTDIYGSATPREFDLSRVTVRNVVVRGDSDKLVVERDVQWLMSQLPNAESRRVDDIQFNHYDMVYNKDIKLKLYPIISSALNEA